MLICLKLTFRIEFINIAYRGSKVFEISLSTSHLDFPHNQYDSDQQTNSSNDETNQGELFWV